MNTSNMKRWEYGGILTASESFRQILETATQVAPSKATVLITGESGTGKELLARFIHEKSPRANREFVGINCAALPDGLLESELFGYEKGAFTGATQSKAGKFEIASHSTILLDEISEMPLLLQAKLLRVLQEEEVDRLGGKAPTRVNLRVIATTNRDLRQMISEGRFREDLYYRLNVIPLRIPSLRERIDDIGLLALHFAQVNGILNNKTLDGLSEAALDKLRAWTWPGNARELENVMERAVLLAKGSMVQTDEIVIDSQHAQQKAMIPWQAGITLAEAERQLIFKTLELTRFNRTRAAEILGISVRTLRNKLHEYGGINGRLI